MASMMHAVLSLIALAALARAQPAPPVLPPFALEGTVDFALQLAAATPLKRDTGLKKADYLPVIEGVVQYMRTVQNASGHIIDPFRGIETQYATPCFAYACATVWSEGLDATLLPNCSAALTAATTELATHSCADGHCVFFMKPVRGTRRAAHPRRRRNNQRPPTPSYPPATTPQVMFAYRLLKPLVDAATLAVWDANLEAMNPWIDFGFPSNNWGLVGAAGDLMRTQLIARFGNTSWSEYV